jgi:hypothetical protein
MRLCAWQVLTFGGLAMALTALLAGPVGGPPRFTDVTRQAGIYFRHENAASSQKFMIETMGAGCAWIDYNQDGLADLYLVNSAGTDVFKPPKPLRSALYRNNGDGTFTDVTASAHVGAENLFGMGVAVGDYDNDGYPDLMVLGYGRSILYHNNGDGTFTDVTTRVGIANAGKWASSAAWFDYDNDGRLDLAIANYVDWTPERNYYCGSQGPGLRSYCHPDDYHGTAPTLYHNNGDGTFTDVTESSGLAKSPSSGLGIETMDYDGDGRQDIFIANDGRANSLFHNNGDGTFTEVAYEAAVAVGDDGAAEAGMGVDAADVSGKGRLDLIVTHLDQQQTRFYRGLGHGIFEDATSAAKLAYATFKFSGFGVRFMDYDNDGWPDIFIAAGHVLDNIARYHPGVTWAEPKLVFHNIGGGIFADASNQLGSDLQTPTVGRGLAAGDYDNDGDLDVLVSNNGGAPQLLRNDGGNTNHWLEVLLIGTRSNRDGVGARVKVRAGDLGMTGERTGGMSYQSAQDPRLHFGLGRRTTVDTLEIRWPSGMVTTLKELPADRILTIREGAGVVKGAFPSQ